MLIPKALPEWFIKLFTKKNDWVLDPFVGSGTTCHVAHELGRNSVGIDVLAQYTKLARARVGPTPLPVVRKVKCG